MAVDTMNEPEPNAKLDIEDRQVLERWLFSLPVKADERRAFVGDQRQERKQAQCGNNIERKNITYRIYLQNLLPCKCKN